MPASIAASIRAVVPSSVSVAVPGRPRLLQPSPTADTESPVRPRRRRGTVESVMVRPYDYRGAMPLAFSQVDVFSGTATGGNPVAVVHGGDGLTDEQMAAFARWT